MLLIAEIVNLYHEIVKKFDLDHHGEQCSKVVLLTCFVLLAMGTPTFRSHLILVLLRIGGCVVWY